MLTIEKSKLFLPSPLLDLFNVEAGLWHCLSLETSQSTMSSDNNRASELLAPPGTVPLEGKLF